MRKFKKDQRVWVYNSTSSAKIKVYPATLFDISKRYSDSWVVDFDDGIRDSYPEKHIFESETLALGYFAKEMGKVGLELQKEADKYLGLARRYALK